MADEVSWAQRLKGMLPDSFSVAAAPTSSAAAQNVRISEPDAQKLRDKVEVAQGGNVLGKTSGALSAQRTALAETMKLQ